MLRWWAAFFIAGIAAPPSGRMVVGGTALAAMLVIWALERGASFPQMQFDDSLRRRFTGAAASCTIICATAIIWWSAAGLGDAMHNRASVPERFTANIEKGAALGADARAFTGGRESGVGGIRSLALTHARRRLLSQLDDGRLTERARALVGALVLGDRSALDFAIRETYSYVGIAHFLALSGMHLGVLAIALSKILSMAVRSKRSADLVLLAVLCIYSAVAGFPASLMRALFLCAAVIAYRLIGMHTDLLGALVAGSFTLVAVDSSIAFDPGFRLSFSAVCGIALIGIPTARLIERFLPQGFRGALIKATLYPALITCSVQFFALPLTIVLFGRTSLLSPLVNAIVSIPFTAFLYLGAVYVFVPLAPLKALLACPLNLLCRFLEAAPAAFSRRPHEALLSGDFNTSVYLCGIALIAWSLRKGCTRTRTALFAGLVCIAVAFLEPELPWRGSAGLHYNGRDAAMPEKALVPFGGGVYARGGGGVVFIGEGFTSRESYRLTRKLWAMGVRRIGCCVVGPSRLRGSNGLFYLLRRVSVDEVICSPYLLKEGSLRGLGGGTMRIEAMSLGDCLSRSGWRIEIVGPVYPPPAGASVSHVDTDLAWRFIFPGRPAITSLDFKGASGYHADP
jgi:ComEC/Rec2-related protein